MHDVLEHMTSYYTRYFGSVTGEESAQWLHDHIADVGTPRRKPDV
jgi:leucyl aminopeptidase